jgi:hypothetical protein
LLRTAFALFFPGWDVWAPASRDMLQTSPATSARDNHNGLRVIMPPA